MGWFGLMVLASVAVDVPPPPIVSVVMPPAGPVRQRGLLSWTPGEARCDGGVAPAGDVQVPLRTLAYDPRPQLTPLTVRFAVGATGRTHSIARVEQVQTYWAGDVAPSLAATRFAAPEKPLSGCSIRYTPSFTALGDAPAADLFAYSVNATSGALPRPVWTKMVAGTDCSGAKGLQPLLRAYPDFSKLPATPGMRDWSLIRFDTDAAGVPVNASVRTGSGNAAFDRAAIAAIGKSRFTPGHRSGCHYPYWKTAGILAAPPSPPEMDKRAVCTRSEGWAAEPALVYPTDYGRRAIEGWAVIRYDVAPWGATGNVTVVDAQPSADFGTQAKSMIERAKAQPSPAGVQGCSVVVRYAMSRDGAAASEPPPPAAVVD